MVIAEIIVGGYHRRARREDFGKPKDKTEAFDFLALEGKRHDVITGLLFRKAMPSDCS